MLNFRRVNTIAVGLLLVCLLLYFQYQWPLWPAFLIVLLWLGLTVLGSFFIGWNYFIISKIANKTLASSWVSITFDDGPHPEYTPKVLDLLEKYDAKATFFCIGKQVEKYPELVTRIIQGGHTVGNHTYAHNPGFGFLSAQKVKSDLQRANDLMKQQQGIDMQLYRPAFGVTNPHIKKAITQLNLIAIGWSKRSLDTTSLSKKRIFNRVTHELKRGDVILLHDTSDKTVAVLERLLPFLQKKGLQSVTVDILFKLKPYA